jgi:hypothetical protein
VTTQLIPADLLARTQIITGLRQLADYLEDHPDVPVCRFGWDLPVYPGSRDGDAAERAQVDKIAALLEVPVTDRTGDGGHYKAVRAFGLITYEAIHVSERRMAAHRALMSYSGSITPAAPEVTA